MTDVIAKWAFGVADAISDVTWTELAWQGGDLWAFPSDKEPRSMRILYTPTSGADDDFARLPHLNDGDTAWMSSAACPKHPEVDFFRTYGAALAICARCVVRDDCLNFALNNNIAEGVWGGMTAKARRRCERPVPAGAVVYFAEGADTGAIKIGTTASLEARLSAQGLTVVATEAGSYQREAELHRRFAHLRIRGEWFRFEGELFEYVTKLDSEEAVAA